jgi:hypothetical protein
VQFFGSVFACQSTVAHDHDHSRSDRTEAGISDFSRVGPLTYNSFGAFDLLKEYRKQLLGEELGLAEPNFRQSKLQLLLDRRLQSVIEAPQHSMRSVQGNMRLLVFTISTAFWLRSTNNLPWSESAAAHILRSGEREDLFEAEAISHRLNQMVLGDEKQLVSLLKGSIAVNER